MELMPSTTNLQISPKKLIGDLTDDERERSPVLFNLTGKPKDQQATSFQLNVIFQEIPVSRGLAFPVNYYVGTISATITIRAVGAEIIDYTGSSTVSVEYEVKNETEDGQTRKFVPKVKLQ